MERENKKRSITPAVRKALSELTLMDRFLFRATMDVPELYKLLVEIIFGEQIEFPDKSKTEKELGISKQLLSVRLDVYDMDEEGNAYTFEMQQKNTYNLPKRSRFYQGQTDISLLPPGCVDYNLLKDVYQVMICPFDIFGRGLCWYTFHMYCEEVPELKLDDGADRIFINTRGKDREKFSEEFLDFLDYLNAPVEEADHVIRTEKVRRLNEGVKTVRAAEQIGVRYMLEWEERIEEQMAARKAGLEEGLSRGLSQGELVKLVSLIRKKIEKGQPDEQIADALEEEISLVCKVREWIGAEPELSDLELVQKHL